MVEQTPSNISIAIWDQQALPLLEKFLAADNLDAAARKKLQPVVDLRREIGRIDTEVDGLRRQQAELEQRADQTRRNLEAIQKDPAAAQLRQKLNKRLEEFATEADTRGRKIVELETRRLERKIELEDMIQDLDLRAPMTPDAKGKGSGSGSGSGPGLDPEGREHKTSPDSSCPGSFAFAVVESRPTAPNRLRMESMISSSRMLADSGSESLSRISASRISPRCGWGGRCSERPSFWLTKTLRNGSILRMSWATRTVADLPSPRRKWVARGSALNRSDHIAGELHIDIVLDTERSDDDWAALSLFVPFAGPPYVVGNREVGSARIATADFVPAQVHLSKSLSVCF